MQTDLVLVVNVTDNRTGILNPGAGSSSKISGQLHAMVSLCLLNSQFRLERRGNKVMPQMIPGLALRFKNGSALLLMLLRSCNVPWIKSKTIKISSPKGDSAT
jgi:hypothetical protein